VAREPDDPPGDEDLGLARPHDGPGRREPVLEIEDVGERVGGGGDAGAAGQCDLAEAEVLHARCALAAELDQHVTEAPRLRAVRPLGGVGGVDRRPLREDLEVVDLSQPTLPHGTARGGQQAGRVELGEGVGHVFDSRDRHRH
jgi:hypothetical protein